jgi:RHS repeat-associated protein
VWVHTQSTCGGSFNDPRCAINPVRRTVWDGDQALYEIQMQEGEAENDGTPAHTTLLAGGLVDPRTSTGRVLHTYGPGIDQPLSVIRLGYVGLAPFAVIPLWDSDGRAPYLVFQNGARCPSTGCGLNTIWAVGNRPYGSKANGYVYADGDFTNRMVWIGNVMQDQHDASGLLYRRNRYYDPQTGRFTQEDPIGLAGGVNLYGFADGDPVSYSDPYGLCPPIWSCLAGYGPKSGFQLASLRKGERRHYTFPTDVVLTATSDTKVRAGFNDAGQLIIFMEGGLRIESHYLPEGAERIPLNYVAINFDTGEFDVWGSRGLNFVTVSVQGNFRAGNAEAKVCIAWVKCVTESQGPQKEHDAEPEQD